MSMRLLRDENLSRLVGRRVHDGDPRRVAELHGLLGERERARDQRLRRDDCRHRREHDEGIT